MEERESGANYPMKWKVAIPAKKSNWKLSPAFRDQELITNRSTRVTYWEGAARISGTARRRPVSGDGYVELTGYAGKLNI